MGKRMEIGTFIVSNFLSTCTLNWNFTFLPSCWLPWWILSRCFFRSREVSVTENTRKGLFVHRLISCAFLKTMSIIIRLCFHDKHNYETILAENSRTVKLTENGTNQVYCNLLKPQSKFIPLRQNENTNLTWT